MILSNHSSVDKQSSEKENEVIKVFVITGSETSGLPTYVSEKNGQKVYSGMAWETLEAVKKLPELKKYEFEYTFSDSGYSNYTETVDWVSTGKYDLGLAVYTQNQIRESKINYTVPFLIDAYALFHYSNKSEIDILNSILSKLGYQFLILIILGIITGLVLFFLEPQRSIATKVKSRKAFMIRSITTGIATFFGEAGFLFENSSSIKGLIAITLIMLISLVFLQFMQAEITTLFIDNQASDKISPLDINTTLAIGHEGYAHTTRWEENGGTVELFKEKNNVELLEVYKENQSKYLGVILSYYDGFPLLDLNPGLNVSIFGNTMESMIYNPRKVKFGEDLNKGLLYIRSTKELREICKGNFKSNIPNPPVSCTM
jgi:hypothetical protein